MVEQSTTAPETGVTVTTCRTCGAEAKVHADGSRQRCQACNADPLAEAGENGKRA